MATSKAKRSASPKAKQSAAPKAGAAKANAPFRARPVQVIARLSVEEKRDLDAMILRQEEPAAAQGFSGKGFADWLRATIRRETQNAGK